jgi:hypothetical protein
MCAAATAAASIEQAMLQLPATLTMAYLEATIRAPDLVRQESDPILFVRNARGNLHEAAIMMAIYWQKRRALFGPERAWLHMHRTDGTSGVLTSQDVAALNQSCLCPLPSDAHGHQVYYVDVAKIANSASDQGLRCLFYLLQQSHINDGSRNPEMMMSTSCSRKGLVQLLMVSDQTPAASLERFVSLMSTMLESMPLPLQRLHILTPTASSPTTATRTTSSFSSSCADATISFLMRLVLAKSLSEECVVTSFVSRQDLIQKLAFYGLHEDCLPTGLGGSYNREISRVALLPHHYSLSTNGPTRSPAITPGAGPTSSRNFMPLYESRYQPFDTADSFPIIEWMRNERARPRAGFGVERDELLTRALLQPVPVHRQLTPTITATRANTAAATQVPQGVAPMLALGFHREPEHMNQQSPQIPPQNHRQQISSSLMSPTWLDSSSKRQGEQQFANALIRPGRWEDEHAMPRSFLQSSSCFHQQARTGATALTSAFELIRGGSNQDDDRKLPAFELIRGSSNQDDDRSLPAMMMAPLMAGPATSAISSIAATMEEDSKPKGAGGKRMAQFISQEEEPEASEEYGEEKDRAGDPSNEEEQEETKRAEEIRKRNALYSRRSYHRNKVELEVLENQVQQITSQNEILQREHQRLEQLHRDAEQCLQKHHPQKTSAGCSSTSASSMVAATAAIATMSPQQRHPMLPPPPRPHTPPAQQQQQQQH